VRPSPDGIAANAFSVRSITSSTSTAPAIATTVLPGAIAVGEEPPDLVARDRADRAALARRLATERVPVEDLLGEHPVDDVLRAVVVHRQLVEDHLPFALDVAVAQCRRRQHVAQQLDPKSTTRAGTRQ
jgi:hypothetical protein